MTIHLQDLLHLSEEDIQRAGIKLMFFDGNKEPIDEWLKTRRRLTTGFFGVKKRRRTLMKKISPLG